MAKSKKNKSGASSSKKSRRTRQLSAAEFSARNSKKNESSIRASKKRSAKKSKTQSSQSKLPRIQLSPSQAKKKSNSSQAPNGQLSDERLQKVLARAGVASRRHCEELITAGRVTVNGKMVMTLGSKVGPSDKIRVDGQKIPEPKRVYYKINKPPGLLSTSRDPDQRRTVFSLLPDSVESKLHIMGRLDEASEGLMILTNDGELTNRVTHPRHGILKKYEVVFHQNIDPEVLAKARAGVWLSSGKTEPMSIRVVKRTKNRTRLEVILKEGKNRIIRRVFAKLDANVVILKRISIGPLSLGRLKKGGCQLLTASEIKKIKEACEL